VICQEGHIEAIDGARARVVLRPRDACRACAEGRGCGAGLLGGWLGRNPVHLELTAASSWRAGDRVAVRVDGRAITLLALRAYALPLLAFLFAVAACAALLPAGATADGVGLVAGIAALLLSARFAGRGAASAVAGVGVQAHRVAAPNRTQENAP